MKKAFTLIEILLVIAILGALFISTLISIRGVREKTYLNAAISNFRSLDTALKGYVVSHNGIYPPDVSRDIPPELVIELKNTDWPKAPWPGSVYDWENWTAPSGEKIYQFSIRFCEYDNPSSCNFPKTKWAEDFDSFSSVFWCIEGPCKSHSSLPESHPGYCVNCDE